MAGGGASFGVQCSWLILNSAPLCGQYIAPMGETFGNNPFSKGLASIMCHIPDREAHFFVKNCALEDSFGNCRCIARCWPLW